MFNPLSSLKGRVIAAFGLFTLIIAIVAGVSAWQAQIHESDLDDLQSHSRAATTLQESEAQAGIAALLLQRYVITGDETLVPEIQQHATAAVESLTEAVALQPVADVSEIAVGGAGLAEGAGQVMALRQAGDLEGAAAAMEEIVPVFREFRLGLEDATALELQEVSNLRSRADRAGQIVLWLLILSGAAGALIGLLGSILVARSVIKPLSSLEEAAIRVSQGDLSARVPAEGPRELAHLGAVLNDMMAAVEARTEELKDRNRQLTDARTQAATDQLTDLGNHRAFHKRIRDDVGRAESSDSGVALILFDIDSFKGYNDSLGHLAGDDLLSELAMNLGSVVKREDAYRYGGDEFAVLLPGTNLKEASSIAERLRVTVERLTISSGQKLTISLGVANFPDTAGSAEELLYRADMAMYWAKSTGKNRVGNWDGLLSRRTGGMTPAYLGNRDGKVRDAIVSLVSALAAKDPVTRDHTERCSWYTAELAEELGLGEEEASTVRLASLLHDIGKLVVPSEVLCKPGPLTEEEWALMKQHPTTALHILGPIDSAAQAVPAILHHHEHFDGSGYPDGLAGEEIPIASRILLVADAFDAMTTDRPYRKARPIDEAAQELRAKSGSQFDPAVVEAFLKLLSRNGAHPHLPAANDGERVAAPLGESGSAT